MIHQITKSFDDRDERGIDCNIWMKLYEAIENYDRDDNIYQGGSLQMDSISTQR